MWSSKGAILGLLSGGLIGMIAGYAPVFHWEMAGLALIPFTCLGGLTGGVLGATRGLVLGLVVGSLSFGTLWLMLSKTATLPSGDPWGIPIAGTVAVVMASLFSSVVASFIWHNAKQRNQD